MPTILPGTLTPEMITELMAGSRNRGGYKVAIQKFVDSGDVALDFGTLSEFKGKEAAAVRNSVALNIAKWGKDANWPPFKVLVTTLPGSEDKTCILVNLDAHAAAVAS